MKCNSRLDEMKKYKLYFIGSSTKMQLYFLEDTVVRGDHHVYLFYYIGLGFGTNVPDYEDGDYICEMNDKTNKYKFIRIFFSDYREKIPMVCHKPFELLSIKRYHVEKILELYFV